MNVTDLCRKNLYSRLGIDDQTILDKRKVAAETKKVTEKFNEIERLAKYRLIMGGIRYGHKSWTHSELMEIMQRKFDVFKINGNYEMLIDLLNFVVIEGVYKTHPNHHFNPIDRDK